MLCIPKSHARYGKLQSTPSDLLAGSYQATLGTLCRLEHRPLTILLAPTLSRLPCDWSELKLGPIVQVRAPKAHNRMAYASGILRQLSNRSAASGTNLSQQAQVSKMFATRELLSSQDKIKSACYLYAESLRLTLDHFVKVCLPRSSRSSASLSLQNMIEMVLKRCAFVDLQNL